MRGFDRVDLTSLSYRGIFMKKENTKKNAGWTATGFNNPNTIRWSPGANSWCGQELFRRGPFEEGLEELRKPRRPNFRRFCQEVKNTPVAARLYKATSIDWTYTESEAQRTLLLLKTHFPGGSRLIEDDNADGSRHASRDDCALAKMIFSPGRIEWANNNLEPFKSHGVDGLKSGFPAKGLHGAPPPYLLSIMRCKL